MAGTKVIKKITEKETDLMKRIIKNAEIASINGEKDMIIERYEKVLNILKCVTINNEEDLVFIKNPLGDLESNLKYIPNRPLFNDIVPTEIKDQILRMSYQCDSRAFIAASVCQEWKGVLETRFKNKKVIIGEDCSKCEENKCVKSEDMLKAAADHKLDAHLVIRRPVTEVDPQLITEALTSVSKFSIVKDYKRYGDIATLSFEQFEHLFKSFEEGEKVMEEVELKDLYLWDILNEGEGIILNQERLANFLINKVKKLTLASSIDFEPFMYQLQEDLSTLKLTHLTQCDFDPNFGPLISPEDLKSVFNKMTTLQLEGYFDLDQLEAIRTLPDVEVIPGFPIHTLKKALRSEVKCYDVARYFKKL